MPGKRSGKAGDREEGGFAMPMTARCPNASCGHVSRLVDDPLGRIFRCPRCLTKLPTAPAAAADAGWTTMVRPALRAGAEVTSGRQAGPVSMSARGRSVARARSQPAVVRMGAEARLVLDAAPQYVIPAKVSFVADVAQFTPKTVETAEERQKLMFRIRARIDPQLLREHKARVKTGLPGMAYVQLDPQAEWPAHLEVRLPQ